VEEWQFLMLTEKVFTKKRFKNTPVPNPKKNKKKKKPESPAIRVSRNTPHGILKTGEPARALRGL
jgi:hypothetical protein